MKAIHRLSIFAMLTALTAAPSLAAEGVKAPQPQTDYAADMSMTMSGIPGMGEMTLGGTVKYDAETQRYRRTQNTGGTESVMLIDVKAESVTIVLPGTKQYMNQKTDKDAAGGPKMADATFLSFEKVGTETINGVATTKHAVRFDETSSGHLWLTKDQIALRTEGSLVQNGQTLSFREELSNLQLGDQDVSNFEIPEGYTKLEMPTMPPVTGAGGGDAPTDPFAGMSDEERQEMQRQFQEQMKKAMEQMQQQQQQQGK